jgi:nucleoside phosphorylase/tetratricopeptide (TPR) repeat protein
MRLVLATLSETIEPLSGRRIASLAGMSPTTANKQLESLLSLGAVSSVHRGRAVYWQTTAAAERMLMAEGQRAERTALVLTALPLEYVAVRERLPVGDERRAHNGTRYLESTVSGVDVRWRVYVFEIGMGNSPTASLISYAVDQFGADLVIFAGVAAGLKPADQEHGDVVIAERVYNAHSGKHSTTPDGRSAMLSRPKGHSTAYQLVQLSRQIARTPGRGPAERARKPKVTLGSIASTEAVVADERSQLFQHIRNQLNDCVAIDMESFGAYEAAHANNVLVIAVRGISDFVEDKAADSDTKWQPVAARNAADVATELLIHAHPDDVPPHKLSPAPSPKSDRDGASQRTLPPHAQVWERRLRKTSPKRAGAAAEELTSDNVIPLASWVSRALNRPPAWLRGDTTGDGWALVAALAETIEAGTAARAYTQAAQVAQKNGDLALAAVHRIRAALSTRISGDDSAAVVEMRGALEAVDLDACAELRPLVAFHLATTYVDNAAVLEAAAPALASLGYDPGVVGLGSTSPITSASSGSRWADIGDRKVASVQVAPVPEGVRMLLAAIVLVTVSVIWLLVEDGESAQRAAEAALDLIPDSPVAQLRRGQAILTRLHAQSPALALEDTSFLLRSIEDSALTVRRARQQWGGNTREALALAGRARIEAGDPVGALRLLQSAPVGQATADEAKSAEVRRFAAIAALLADDYDLALNLASTLVDDIEAHLVRGAAFSRSHGMRDEAQMSYLRALELAGDNPRYLERALLGLARLGFPVGDDGRQGTGSRLQTLRDQDPQAADLVLGNAALTAGDYEKALSLARRYRTAFQAVELETYALIESGDAADAVARLDSFGQDRGDNSLRIQAMMLARQAGLDEKVDEIADAVIGAEDGELRRMAREAKAEAAGRRLQWAKVSTQARLLMEELDRSDPQQATVREAGYRWIRAEALYRRRKFAMALREIFKSAPLAPTRREQVLFVLAVANALVSESPKELPEDAFEWVLALSASWIKDEEIGAETSKLILLVPAVGSDATLMRARTLLEDYFATRGDNSPMRRIELPLDADDPTRHNLAPLVEHLRSQFEPQAKVLSKLTPRLRLDQLPAAFLADVTHRSYAESLIKQVLGYYPIREEPSIRASSRLSAAHDALRSQRVVADTSALVIGGKLGIPWNHLTGLFRQVIFPASLRDDIYNARAVLSHHSDMTIGWDPAASRPTIARYDAEVVRGWAEDADKLQSDLAHLSIQPDVRDNDRSTWNAALLLAKQAGVPLWADDIALRVLADSEEVQAFGTLDLLDEARRDGRLEQPTQEDVRAALVVARAVDLPFPAPWWVCAQNEGWNPGGYTALSISRPAAWANHAAAFAQYRDLIRNLVNQSSQEALVERITGWAAAAATGSAWATWAGARPKVVGVLLAWTALNAEPMLDATTIRAHTLSPGRQPETVRPPHAGEVLDALLTIATAVQATAFPDGDGIHHVVVTLADTIRTITDGITTAAVVAQALDALSDEHRPQAMAAFLASPAAAGPDKR